MASNTSTTCSGCKWEHSSGRFQKKDEKTGYIWTYSCPGTACANWKTGTPTNMHWGCSKYQKRESVAVQMTLNDVFPDIIPPPKVWDCMKTCANFHVYEPDNFPMGGKRCTYGRHMNGCTGKDMYEKVTDNVVTFYCKYYKKEVWHGREYQGTT